MLHPGSILLKICILALVFQAKCQNYDYAVEESGEGGDHSDFTADEADSDGDSEHYEEPHDVDYSKYYAEDTSAPLITAGAQSQSAESESSGFAPSDYTFFGSSPDFGASTNQAVKNPKNQIFNPVQKPVQPIQDNFNKDFFEESQKQQKLEEEEDVDGVDEDDRDGSSSDYKYETKIPEKYKIGDPRIEDEVERVKPRKNKPKDEEEVEDDIKEVPLTNSKNVDYNTGKSSSTVSQYPFPYPGYYNTYPKPASTTLSPYQKYSFQPTKNTYLDTLVSTAAPFNPNYNKKVTSGTQAVPVFAAESSKETPANLKGCKKLQKAISYEDSMNCFVCEDPNNKSKYTQCSYSNEEKPTEYLEKSSSRYSQPNGNGYRYKRDSDNQEEEKADETDDSDPYEYIRRRSEESYKEPDHDKQFNEEFQYSPDFESEESNHQKSFSEAQSEELKKNPENCKKVEKDGMTCTVCLNPKTGGNFEQCSYTSAPKDEKYAYTTNKKYDSDAEQPEETKNIGKTKKVDDTEDKFSKEQKDIEPIEAYEGKIKSNKRPERQNSQFSKRRYEESRRNSKNLDIYKDETQPKSSNVVKQRTSDNLEKEDTYSAPDHFAQSKAIQAELGLDSTLYGGKFEDDDDDSDKSKKNTEEEQEGQEEKEDNFNKFDDYHYKLFPGFENDKEETKLEEQTDGNPAETSQKDVEVVLAEFRRKDRSNCKKAEKNGMTCFLCVDDKKIKHEECMFISKPEKQHLAYHEVQETSKPNEEDESASDESKTSPKVVALQAAAPKIVAPKTAAPSVKKIRKVKKAIQPAQLILQQAASQTIESIVEFEPKKTKVPKKYVKDLKTAQTEYEEHIEDGDEAEEKEDIEDDGKNENIENNENENNESENNENESAENQSAENKSAENENNESESNEEEPTIQTPAEFNVADDEGAYSIETKPVYSKSLGLTLPRYMVDKSEFEQEFDVALENY